MLQALLNAPTPFPLPLVQRGTNFSGRASSPIRVARTLPQMVGEILPI